MHLLPLRELVSINCTYCVHQTGWYNQTSLDQYPCTFSEHAKIVLLCNTYTHDLFFQIQYILKRLNHNLSAWLYLGRILNYLKTNLFLRFKKITKKTVKFTTIYVFLIYVEKMLEASKKPNNIFSFSFRQKALLSLNQQNVYIYVE